jgi:formate--tetrahydrofolate ligase
LARDIEDLKQRIGNIVIGYTYTREPVYVRDLKIEGALALLLKDAIKPNLVQTIEGTPALVHGGPFANIAHGCNSVIATTTALKLGDVVITEAGFGADLGAEKFLNIKTPNLPKAPDAIVIVATIRALKMHGGVKKDELQVENVQALEIGFQNLEKHIENMQSFNRPVVVAINEFVTDTEQEINALLKRCAAANVEVSRCSVWENGGKGGVELAAKLLKVMEEEVREFTPTYQNSDSVEEKVKAIVQKIYGGRGVHFEKKAATQLETFKKFGWDKLPICMAKTQYSLSDDPTSLGKPSDFDITIREFIPKLGAGFIVALTGDVMTMPGLPKQPAALKMDVDKDGHAIGLF